MTNKSEIFSKCIFHCYSMHLCCLIFRYSTLHTRSHWWDLFEKIKDRYIAQRGSRSTCLDSIDSYEHSDPLRVKVSSTIKILWAGFVYFAC